MDSDAVEDMAGPLLKPFGVDGAPLSDVGEWLLPFSTAGTQTQGGGHVKWVGSCGGSSRHEDRGAFLLLILEFDIKQTTVWSFVAVVCVYLLRL